MTTTIETLIDDYIKETLVPPNVPRDGLILSISYDDLQALIKGCFDYSNEKLQGLDLEMIKAEKHTKH